MQKKQIDITDNIMSIIKNGQIKMKPRWYFVIGSISMIVGMALVFMVSIYSIRIFMFSLRSHGPMATLRFQEIMSNFPLWAPLLAIITITIGVKLLKKYDFSYKKNFPLLIISIISAILLAGFLIDYLNIDSILFKKGLGQKIYQQYGGVYRQEHRKLRFTK